MNIEVILKHYSYDKVKFNTDKIYVTKDKTQPHTCDGYHILVPECNYHEQLVEKIKKITTRNYSGGLKRVDIWGIHLETFTLQQRDENYNVFNWKNSLNNVGGFILLEGDFVNFRGNPYPLSTLFSVNDLLINYLKSDSLQVTPFHNKHGISAVYEGGLGLTLELIPFYKYDTLQFYGKDSVVSWVEDLAELLICDEYSNEATSSALEPVNLREDVKTTVELTIQKLIDVHNSEITLTKACKYVVYLDEKEYYIPSDKQLIDFLDTYERLTEYLR